MQLTLRDLYNYNVDQSEGFVKYLMDLTGMDGNEANDAMDELLEELDDAAANSTFAYDIS